VSKTPGLAFNLELVRMPRSFSSDPSGNVPEMVEADDIVGGIGKQVYITCNCEKYTAHVDGTINLLQS